MPKMCAPHTWVECQNQIRRFRDCVRFSKENINLTHKKIAIVVEIFERQFWIMSLYEKKQSKLSQVKTVSKTCSWKHTRTLIEVAIRIWLSHFEAANKKLSKYVSIVWFFVCLYWIKQKGAHTHSCAKASSYCILHNENREKKCNSSELKM